MHFRIGYTINAEDIFRSSIGCEIMLMIKARIRYTVLQGDATYQISKLLVLWFQTNIYLRPKVKYFTDRSKAVLLLWIFYGFFSALCLL